MSIHFRHNVNVIRFCHHLTVKRKCHHEGDGDIEQERTEEVSGVRLSGRGKMSDRETAEVLDTWDSYHGIWLAFAGLAVIVLVLITTIPRLYSSLMKGQVEGTTPVD